MFSVGDGVEEGGDGVEEGWGSECIVVFIRKR